MVSDLINGENQSTILDNIWTPLAFPSQRGVCTRGLLQFI